MNALVSLVGLVLKQAATQRDNSTYSASKIAGGVTIVVMLGKFIHSGSEDFVELGLGVSVILAAWAGKFYVEGKSAT